MDSKICSKCKQVKSLTEFSFRNKKQGIIETRCKKCKKEYGKQHYKNNYKDYKDRAIAFAKKQRKINLSRISDYLRDHPCVDCGETDIVVLQFDHVRGKKIDSVPAMANHGAGWKKVNLEIEKCEIRCANCHMRKTAKERNWKWKK